MRPLNLNEKIGLKGLLVARGVPISGLVKTSSINTFNQYWKVIFGRPISMWNTQKQWHKSWKSKEK